MLEITRNDVWIFVYQDFKLFYDFLWENRKKNKIKYLMRDLVARSNCCDYFSYFGFTVKYFMLQLF